MRKLIILTLALAGCTSHGQREAMTSGAVGCPTGAIQISEGDMGWTTNTWTARCNNRTYYCTYISGGGTSCTPAG